MIGMPIIGIATTEMTTVVENDVSGYVDTDVRRLVPHMQALLNDPAEAHRLGANARRYAQARFNIHRFIQDWNSTFARVTGQQAYLSITREAPVPAVRPASFQQAAPRKFRLRGMAEGDHSFQTREREAARLRMQH